MGSNESANKSLNILVFGIKYLVDSEKIEADWRKDQVNSTIDFDLYENIRLKPQIVLWCPKQESVLQQTVESIILNISFEGVLYVFENDKNLKQHKKLIQWLMNEDTMRQCSLIIIALNKEDNNKNDEQIKQLIESELDLESMDSKQARQLMLFKNDGKDPEFNKLLSQLIKMKNES